MAQEKKFNKNDFAVKRSYAGLGLFSNKEFKKNDFIIEYTGKLLTVDQANKKGGKYLFSINSKWVLDGTARRHLARYINHACKPNAEARVSGKHVYVYATKKINPGDEIVYNYGKEYFDEYIKPRGCKCQSCRK